MSWKKENLYPYKQILLNDKIHTVKKDEQM